MNLTMTEDDDEDEDADDDDSDDSDDSESASDEEPSKKRKADDEPAVSAKKAKKETATDVEDTGSKNLFVGNLSWNVDDEWLYREFEEFGELTGARVISDRESGRSKGFGYVEFAKSADAAKALKAKKGALIDGREANVDFSTPRGTTKHQRSVPINVLRALATRRILNQTLFLLETFRLKQMRILLERLSVNMALSQMLDCQRTCKTLFSFTNSISANEF